MNDLSAEPLAALVSWSFPEPMPLVQWQALIRACLQLLADGSIAAGRRVIGHIRAQAVLPNGGYIRATLHDAAQGTQVEVEATGQQQFAELVFTINVLVYGLPYAAASRQVEGAARVLACEFGGATRVGVGEGKHRP